MIEKYTNERGKVCYRGVTPETPFVDLEFYNVPEQFESNVRYALFTNLGNLTVLDRMTGFGYRDTETGYRDMEGNFWLASGMQDVRKSDATTMQEAINWVKKNANSCIGV